MRFLVVVAFFGVYLRRHVICHVTCMLSILDVRVLRESDRVLSGFKNRTYHQMLSKLNEQNVKSIAP